MRKLLILLLCLTMASPALADPIALTYKPTKTATSYKSGNVEITITAKRHLEADVFVADIRVASVENIRRVYAGSGWGQAAWKVKDLARESGAILAITGDSAQNISAGWCIGNGEVQRATLNTKRDLGVLFKDGSFMALPAPVDHQWLQQVQGDIWQTFLFGPVLLDSEGRAMTTFNSAVKPRNPRSVFGYYEPGHYCFVQVDGRGTASRIEEGKKNYGLTLAELSALMESLGCASAYNLDGGRSSMMWFGGEYVSTPSKGGRAVGDILTVMD